MIPLPLSRRDRASLQLAYECIRRGYSLQCSWTNEQRSGNCEAQLFDARAALTAGKSRWTYDLRSQLGCVFREPIEPPPRLLRARLALLLRAILRADAGDFGRRWPRDVICSRHGFVTRIHTDDHPRFYRCTQCSHEYRALWSEEAQRRFTFAPRYSVPVPTLWELAARKAAP